MNDIKLSSIDVKVVGNVKDKFDNYSESIHQDAETKTTLGIDFFNKKID